MFNQPQVQATLARLPDQTLYSMDQNPVPPTTPADIQTELARRAQSRAGVTAIKPTAPAANPNPMGAQPIGQAPAPAPQDQGIAALPAQNLSNMAAGGIVPSEGLPTTREGWRAHIQGELDRRAKMAAGGTVQRFTSGGLPYAGDTRPSSAVFGDLADYATPKLSALASWIKAHALTGPPTEADLALADYNARMATNPNATTASIPASSVLPSWLGGGGTRPSISAAAPSLATVNGLPATQLSPHTQLGFTPSDAQRALIQQDLAQRGDTTALASLPMQDFTNGPATSEGVPRSPVVAALSDDATPELSDNSTGGLCALAGASTPAAQGWQPSFIHEKTDAEKAASIKSFVETAQGLMGTKNADAQAAVIANMQAQSNARDPLTQGILAAASNLAQGGVGVSGWQRAGNALAGGIGGYEGAITQQQANNMKIAAANMELLKSQEADQRNLVTGAVGEERASEMGRRGLAMQNLGNERAVTAMQIEQARGNRALAMQQNLFSQQQALAAAATYAKGVAAANSVYIAAMKNPPLGMIDSAAIQANARSAANDAYSTITGNDLPGFKTGAVSSGLDPSKFSLGHK